MYSNNVSTWALLQGDLTRSLEGLLNLEKQARVAEDVTASKAACSAVLNVCHKAKDLKQLEEHIVLLAKRRGQLKQVRGGAAAHV
jgi:26S proteasome regulatory subunit N5